MSSIENAQDVLRGVLRRGKVNGKLAVRTFSRFPAHNKVGLGLGITSLGLGVANYHRNSTNMDLNEQRVELDQKSLSALQKIHKALSAKPKVVE